MLIRLFIEGFRIRAVSCRVSLCGRFICTEHGLHNITPAPRNSNRNSNCGLSGRPRLESGVNGLGFSPTDWVHSEGHTKYLREKQCREQKLLQEELCIIGSHQRLWLKRWHCGNPFAPQIDCQTDGGQNNDRISSLKTHSCSTPKVGEIVDVLLLNLGTPESPTSTCLWKYLRGKGAQVV